MQVVVDWGQVGVCASFTRFWDLEEMRLEGRVFGGGGGCLAGVWGMLGKRVLAVNVVWLY
jgi:hypothetical protein